MLTLFKSLTKNTLANNACRKQNYLFFILAIFKACPNAESIFIVGGTECAVEKIPFMVNETSENGMIGNYPVKVNSNIWGNF